MKDRIPRHPGRVRLNPVAGQANVYDLIRADEPVETGTEINKAALLKDATAALYNLSAASIPDDALMKLSNAIVQAGSGAALTSIKGGSVTVPLGNIPTIPASKVSGLSAEATLGSCVAGSYMGDGTANRLISIGFRPHFVLIQSVGITIGKPIITCLKTYYLSNVSTYRIGYPNESTFTATNTVYLTASNGFTVGTADSSSGGNSAFSTNLIDGSGAANKYYYAAIGRA